MQTLKILVVDDEPGIRSGIVRILKNYTVGYPFMEEDFDFETLECETGEEALDMLEKEPIDIILLDNKLPGMDGIEVLEHIRKNELKVLVMMITSYASLELAVKATQNGAYNFVPKPFTPQELKSAMENITKHLVLKRMTSEMGQQGKEVRFQFLSLLSHELKSPVNAVEGYLRMMKDKQAGDQVDDYMMMVDRSLERIKGMRSLISDLLDLTRIESGNKTRETKTIDLCEIARKSIQSVEPLADQRKVEIVGEMPGMLEFNGDYNEIEIVFNNLLSNAVKYNKECGKVFVRLLQKDQNIWIVVEDTGIGMKEEDKENLFKEFVRIKNSKTKNISGSGLGLSILKKIVDDYNGEIKVDSVPDKGTAFEIKLPG